MKSYGVPAFILLYQKKDREYGRVMSCELRFQNEDEMNEFIEELKLDRNVLEYCTIKKEIFKLRR